LTIPFVTRYISRRRKTIISNRSIGIYKKYRKDFYSVEGLFSEFYTAGDQYKRQVNFGTCSIISINNSTFGIQNGTIQSIESLFHFSPNYVHTYNGVRRARGILCDVYSFPITVTNSDGSSSMYNLLWFFTNQQWTYDNGLPAASTRIPIRMVMLGNYTTKGGVTNQINIQVEIYNFMPFIPYPNVFDIPATMRCGLTNDTDIFAIFKLNLSPNSFDSQAFATSLSSQLNISYSNIDIVEILQEMKSNAWHTIVITMIYAQASQLQTLNNTLQNLANNLPTTLGNYQGYELDYTLSLDCDQNCVTGRCHFGICACDDGWSGQYCDVHLISDNTGQLSNIVIYTDFDNFSGTAFIIGFCFLFVGVLIGYVIFKWRYKLNHP